MQNWFRRKELVSPPYDKCGIFAKQDLEFHAGEFYRIGASSGMPQTRGAQIASESRAIRQLSIGRTTLEGQRVQIGISPRRIPRVTASVRVEASSLSRIELMWNLTVCSEIPRRAAISLLTSPSANILSTSGSREGISPDSSSSTSSGRSP